MLTIHCCAGHKLLMHDGRCLSARRKLQSYLLGSHVLLAQDQTHQSRSVLHLLALRPCRNAAAAYLTDVPFNSWRMLGYSQVI